ncbi:rolling circle replication-associated protein [Blautia marasmi]|uniref:rolling circle replication-associated protein n=1 Tax=Blautia marasmi TaxID=1917868 RepID=UPI000CF1FEC4|nr:hypothetical protein [Blautia marasmi]
MDYNVKCLHYVNGDTETRIYSRPIRIGVKKEEKKKEEKRTAQQTEEQKKRSAESSMNRTKNKIYEIARANKWQWFLTLTFSQEEVDRYDYSACTKALSKWLNNIRRLAPDMVYLFVPEQHKDGAWHFHGVINHAEGIKIAPSGHYTKDNQPIYNVSSYSLGYSTATEVDNTDAVSRYITKYVTKDLCEHTKGKKRYWVSRNASRPIVQLFEMTGQETMILTEELREDCQGEKFVQCPNTPRNIRYFQNAGLTICHEEIDIPDL